MSSEQHPNLGLAQGEINVKSLGVKGDGTNDTQPILDALNSIKTTGGVLYFPKGIYSTDPIDLTSFKNIVLRGCNETNHFPYIPQTIIKIRSAGEVGIKCSSTGVETPIEEGRGILIENIYLDCDYKVDIGINMNLAVTVKNTCVRYSNGHGIVLEGKSYPVELRRVVSQFNKGHGLYVKAPFTTVYNLYDCEFGFNDLYGGYVEDGSTCLWQNVLVQSNKQGGLKFKQQNPNLYSKPIFLERFNFANLYTEANGTLDPSDPNYEGNYALRIEGFNTDGSISTGKIADFSFTNCSVNKSPKGNFAYIRGTDGLTIKNSPNLNDAVDTAYNRSVRRFIGTSRFDGLLDLSNLKGGQIKFPAVQLPSTDPNILDDYEEGTFAFEIGQNAAASFTPSVTKICRYIKVGRVVHCFVDYEWSDKSTADGVFYAMAKNLPHPVVGGTYEAVSYVEMVVSGGTTDRWSIAPLAGATQCYFRKNGSTVYAKISDFPASGRLSCVFSYVSAT
ncbi:glycosyl hydrolase family 28-related protein [Peribacillus frigoritolerans]|uniref:glycosyl hydrolase family 28-related protein n=1 Tax=Peribacillus frigoritolerans TaxID=450367 RepID=UPI003018CDC1